MTRRLSLLGLAGFAFAVACGESPTGPGYSMSDLFRASMAGPPLPGAVFTTNVGCTGTNLNIYGSKLDVYLDGGPAHPGAAGLPNGSYFVQVTDPSGATVLGTSVGSDNNTPVTVVDGEFEQCYQLWAILIKGSGLPGKVTGYDDTPNPGGEYKVWVSNVETFDNNSTKTDNFKVKSDDECEEDCVTPQGTITVAKFYDANANGIFEPGLGEVGINGWKIRITDGTEYIRFTPVNILVEPDDYTVTEEETIETNWIHTACLPAAICDSLTQASFSLPEGGTVGVLFGNVCTGAGGGMTLGFWSNKNGQALFTNADKYALIAANLRNANGTHFDPASYAAFRTWLLSANATNMAYMLSAQYSAMLLNVRHNKVSAGALIYAPGTNSANALGFATVGSILNEANTELGLHGNTTVGAADGAFRSYQEALKNALDRANNNLNFVQATPCAITFADDS